MTVPNRLRSPLFALLMAGLWLVPVLAARQLAPASAENALPLALSTTTAWTVEPLPLTQRTVSADSPKAWPVTPAGHLRVLVALKGEPAIRSADRAAVQAEQATVLAALHALDPAATVDYRYDWLFNGFSAEISAETLPALTALPGVLSVWPDTLHRVTLDASLDLLRMPVFWSILGGQGNAGSGIKIAVIDSGIEPSHPLFANPANSYTMPPGYPKGYCATQPAFCNGKIIAARWYGSNGAVPAFASPLELPTPQDRQGHGSHVAAIAAGNAGITAGLGDGLSATLSGVAPRAWLLVYKACWREASGPQSASCLTSGLLAALEDAVLDGADILNNSWAGGPAGNPLGHPYRSAIENAVAAGVTVVFAAGNDGPQAESLYCPGCLQAAITVGATTTDRLYGQALAVTGPGTVPGHLVQLAALPSAENPPTTPINALLRDAIALNPHNSEGCNPWPIDAFYQRVALIARGGCAFETKLFHATAAGARAVVISNNQPGPPFRMNVGTETTIPAVMISQADGQQLRQWAAQHPDAAVLLDPVLRHYRNAAWQDIVWLGSARGPAPDRTILKPDLVAPGVEILSADDTATPTTGVALLTGTSMAAPHVAGAAALLKQRFPAWTPAQIKAALMGSAAPVTRLQENGAINATPFDRGAGRLAADRLALIGATVERPSWAEPACAGSCTAPNRLFSWLAIQRTWQATVEAPAGLAVTVTPQTLAVPGGGNLPFAVTVDTSGVSPFQWHHATLVWQETGGGATPVRIPLAIYALPGESGLFEKSADYPFPLRPGDTLTYTLRLRNAGDSPQMWDISDPLPANATYIAGSASAGLSWNAAQRRLTATATVPPTFGIASADLGGYITLAGLLPPHPCAGLCDDDWFEASGLDFWFQGRHIDTFYINTNGFVTLTPPQGALNVPQRLPDPTLPNGVIAPFWTDLDLQGDHTDTAGGGHIYTGIVRSDANPAGWTVIEWKDAQHWGVPQLNYSFQLWIQNGTANLWYAYGPLSDILYPAVVGVEDGQGHFGHTHFFKPQGQPAEGTPPDQAYDLLVQHSPGVVYTFRVSADDGQELVNVATATGTDGVLVATERTPITRAVIWLPLVTR